MKILIVLLALWFLYQNIFVNEDKNLTDSYQWFLRCFQEKSTWPLFFALFLMFVNWFLDAIKWKFLIRKLEDVSIWLSVKAVFLGITVSIFTPNRVGEFGGRVFCLEKADRIKAVLITVIGNIGQLLATTIFGILGLVYYIKSYSGYLEEKPYYWVFILIFLTVILISTLIGLYLNASWLSNFLMKFKFLRKYQQYSDVFSYYSTNELLYVIFLSCARYAVFSLQFYIFLLFFNVDITLLESLTMSSLVFLTISIIPTIALVEVGVRASIATELFKLVTNNSIGVLTATTGLWFTNLVLPALLGIILVYNLKFFRK